MKTLKLFIFLALVLININVFSQAQGLIATRPNIIDSTFSTYEMNTPGNTYGNQIDWINISHFRLKVRSPKIYFDSLAIRNDGSIGSNKVVWINTSSGQLQATSFSLLVFPVSQISGLATVATTGDYNDLSNKPSTGGVTNISSVANGARNFNQAYQLSTTKYTDIRLSTQISCNLSLTGGQSGQIFLEYSTNGTTGWTLAGEVTGSNTGTLTIGLNTTQISGSQVSVILPPSYYWRLRTNNVTGTPTYSFLGGLEITY